MARDQKRHNPKSGNTTRRTGGAEKDERLTTGRTLGGAATSYTSVGGEGRGTPRRDQGGAVHEVEFRPSPGGVIEEVPEGQDVPYSGEGASTRGSTFEENPDTGRTPEEEEREMLTQSLEKRTRAFESG